MFYVMLADFFCLVSVKKMKHPWEKRGMSESLNFAKKSRALKHKIIHSFFVLAHAVLLDHLSSKFQVLR